MAFTNADLLAIKAELTNDPLALGYVSPPGIDDVGNADKLNLVRTICQIDREAIPVSEIAVNVDRDEYVALAQADREWMQLISAGGTVNPKSGGKVREGLLQLFGPGTQTRTSLTALLTEDSSRINQLYKLGLISQGGNVTPSDVANARNAV